MRYLSKPSEIEAFQWTGLEAEDPLMDDFMRGAPIPQRIRFDGDDLQLRAGKDGAQGWVPVPIGHWIVRNPGDHSDYWPVDPDYFASKYEPALRLCRACHYGHFNECEDERCESLRLEDRHE